MVYMKKSRLIWLAASGYWLLPVACDAPPETDAAKETAHRTPLQRNTTAKALQTDEATHFEQITRLLASPQNTPSYAQEVKRLALNYLEQHYQSPERRDAVIRGYIHTLTEHAERFSGKDFDTALQLCQEITAKEGQEPDAEVLQYAIRVADYRIGTEAKNALLQEIDTCAQAAEQEGNTPKALHLLHLLARHAPEQQTNYAERYYTLADYAGAPHRVEMLAYAGNLPIAQQVSILTQECAPPSAADQASIRTAIHKLLRHQTADSLQALFTHPHTANIALAERLLQQMESPAPDVAAIQNTAKQLSAIVPTPAPPYTELALALYESRHAAASASALAQAEAKFRNLLATESPCRTEATEGLAELLLNSAHSTPSRQQEACKLYQELAQHSNPAIAARALERLLQFYLAERQHQQATDTCHHLLKLGHSSTNRLSILQTMAEIAEIRQDIGAAITHYSQIEAESLGRPTIGAPACLRMMQLLLQRNNPHSTNPGKATFTPSDKWYAWQRGSMFLNTLTTTPEEEQHIPALPKIRELTNRLNLDYDIRAEDRAIKNSL